MKNWRSNHRLLLQEELVAAKRIDCECQGNFFFGLPALCMNLVVGEEKWFSPPWQSMTMLLLLLLFLLRSTTTCNTAHLAKISANGAGCHAFCDMKILRDGNWKKTFSFSSLLLRILRLLRRLHCIISLKVSCCMTHYDTFSFYYVRTCIMGQCGIVQPRGFSM